MVQSSPLCNRMKTGGNTANEPKTTGQTISLSHGWAVNGVEFSPGGHKTSIKANGQCLSLHYAFYPIFIHSLVIYVYYDVHATILNRYSQMAQGMGIVFIAQDKGEVSSPGLNMRVI